MFDIERAAVRQMQTEGTKRTSAHHLAHLLNGHGGGLPLPFYHLSPNCSPAFPLRAMPPFSGPLRLGTANSRGGSSTSAFSLAPSVAFSGFAMAALSERLIRWASGSTSSTLH